MKKVALITTVMVTAWMFQAAAADEGGPQAPGGDRQGPGGGQQQGGPGREGGKRPVPPIIKALDANGDGTIDASEIANASIALKSLDKNGDGKLTPDETRPPRPPRPDGDEGGQHREPPPPQNGPDNQ